eukprot:5581579-Amphidinium_carterae.1
MLRYFAAMLHQHQRNGGPPPHCIDHDHNCPQNGPTNHKTTCKKRSLTFTRHFQTCQCRGAPFAWTKLFRIIFTPTRSAWPTEEAHDRLTLFLKAYFDIELDNGDNKFHSVC